MTTPKAHATDLTKRCDCGSRKWTACDHPWRFHFHFKKTAAIYGGKARHRYSLDEIAEARGLDKPRSKSAAASLADVVKAEIRAGVFRPPNAPAPTPPIDPSALTVDDVIAQYTTRHVEVPGRRPTAVQAMKWALGVISRTAIPAAHGETIALGQKPITDVTKADLEAFRSARRAIVATLPTSKGGEVGLNRLTARLRHIFSWSIQEGHLDRTPFQRHGQTVVKLTKETSRDRRLLAGDEEDRLLAAAGPHLKAVILMALGTGGRLSELLGLRFRDVRVQTTPSGQTRTSVVFRAESTKTGKTRVIPVGQNLAALMAMRRHAPDGTLLGPEAFVLGNAVGEQIATVKKAWATAVLKANGHTPTWQGKNHLSNESREAYRRADLHLHDLRRESASRLLEAGATLAEVRDYLGHSNITQTSSYLGSTVHSLEAAIDRREAHEDRERQRYAAAMAASTDRPLSRDVQ